MSELGCGQTLQLCGADSTLLPGLLLGGDLEPHNVSPSKVWRCLHGW